MVNSWGTQVQWERCAFGWIHINPQTVKGDLVNFLHETYISGNIQDAKNLRRKMEGQGIWPQALQIAKENDINLYNIPA